MKKDMFGCLKNWKQISGWIIFGLLIYFPVFQDIDRLPIQFWDESRNAINAFEMSLNGNYLTRHYNGKPDMWEVNPPLLTWLQAASMKLFGYNEFALRFPTSLAVLFTVFLLILFIKKECNNYWPGILSSLVLVTSSGYIGIHIGRTGDHDAVLVLFLTAASLNYYLHLKYFHVTSRYLIYTTLFLILAVYTKSIAGLFTLPGIFFYTAYKKQLKEIFSDYRTYISFVVFGAAVTFYYVLREVNAPGSWSVFWNNGLLHRFTNTNTEVEFFNPGYWWYFKNFYDSRFTYWIPALFIPFFLIAKIKKEGIWEITLFAYIVSFSTLFILSAGTKQFWYDGPVYPFFALICGIGLYEIFRLISTQLNLSKIQIQLVSGILIFLLFYYPYSLIIDKVYKAKEWDTRLYNGLFIRHLKKENKSYLNYSMFFQWYNAPVEFYVKALNADGKHNVVVLGDQIQHLKIQDTIMSCDWASYHILDKAFILKTIESFEHCRMFVIEEIKR